MNERSLTSQELSTRAKHGRRYRRREDMLGAAADYDAAVKALRTQTLPAIVEYTEQGTASGLKRIDDGPIRVVIDTRTNRIVSKTGVHKDDSLDDDDGPVTRRIFNPVCYSPARERATNWNGHSAIAISVEKAGGCKNQEFDVGTVYADATTGDLLGADGSETDEGISIDYNVEYARFNNYVMPLRISAHAKGHGWLFWARERAEIRYSDYVFHPVRRQGNAPGEVACFSLGHIAAVDLNTV
jgi:hypothetical protein